MSVISVIVVGAAGRMGSTLTRMIRESSDLVLAAVLERPGREREVADPGCPVGSDPTAVLAACPGAVLVDFTAPAATMETARLAAARGNPVVIGTTGLSRAQERELAALAEKSPLFLSPNMSVGINVLLDILPALTGLLGETYDVELMEIHHNRKKDAPSGTALRLLKALAGARGWDGEESARYCREGMIGERPQREIGVQSLRGGDVTGVHTVYYMGPGERLEISHHAHSRENFASGALRAVRWMHGREAGKLYSMQDVLHG
jgi:4-hydroxy-tetrahydrodipicolinate reductase